MHLLLTEYLKESFHSTAYSINVYVQSGPNALRLSRFRQEQVEAGQGPRISLTFVKKGKNMKEGIKKGKERIASSAKGKKRQREESESESGSGIELTNYKGKKRMRELEDNDAVETYEGDDDNFIVPDDAEEAVEEPKRTTASWPFAHHPLPETIPSSDIEEDGWSFDLGPSRSNRSGRDSVKKHAPVKSKSGVGGEVIEISD